MLSCALFPVSDAGSATILDLAGFNHADIAALQLLKSKLLGQLNGAGAANLVERIEPLFGPTEPGPFASVWVERPEQGLVSMLRPVTASSVSPRTSRLAGLLFG